MPEHKVVEGRKVRCALVGLGGIGSAHLQAMSGAAGAELVAVAEPREAARAAAKERGLRCYADARDPGLAQSVDAVVIATPPATHHELACHFLERGVHVLCEKPLAPSVSEARSMLQLAHGLGLELMMASKFRYVGDVVEARALLDSGLIGPPVLLENTFSGKVQMKDRWNSQRAIAGGGVLIDNGTHSVDIARFLLGPLVEVQALLGPSLQDLEVEDSARLFFRASSGAHGTADLTWSLQKEAEGYVTVYSRSGTVVLGWRGSRYRAEGGAGWVPFGEGYDKLRCLRAQFVNFVGVVQGSDRRRITAADALASVEVIEAAYASASAGHPLPVGAAS